MKQRVKEVAPSLLVLLCYISSVKFDFISSVIDKGSLLSLEVLNANKKTSDSPTQSKITVGFLFSFSFFFFFLQTQQYYLTLCLKIFNMEKHYTSQKKVYNKKNLKFEAMLN